MNEHADALVLDHFVRLLDPLGIFHGVGHARTAAILDPDAHTHDRLDRIRHDEFDSFCGGIGESDHLRSRPHAGHLHLLLPGLKARE
jgi:hypothetical protein